MGTTSQRTVEEEGRGPWRENSRKVSPGVSGRGEADGRTARQWAGGHGPTKGQGTLPHGRPGWHRGRRDGVNEGAEGEVQRGGEVDEQSEGPLGGPE